MSPKALVRGGVERAAAAMAPMFWRRREHTMLVMMYHRVLPPGHPEIASEQPGMFVTPSTLRMHLRVLKAHFELMHLDQWLMRAAQGMTLPLRACAITFDDGWRDNYVYAYPLLEREQVPATVYVVTDLVGTSYSFWPNRLARWLRSAPIVLAAGQPRWFEELVAPALVEPPTLEVIDRIIEDCKRGHTDKEMTEITEALPSRDAQAILDHPDLMTWDEIRAMGEGGLINFGSHTRRHTRLSGIQDPERLETEIAGSKLALLEQLGAAPATFCYPNGDAPARAVERVRAHYAGAVTTQRGWNHVGDDRFRMRRVGVHEDVAARESAFVARLAGWI